MKTSKEYREIARENLKSDWGNSIVVCLVVSIASSLLSFIPIVGSIIFMIIQGQLIVGEFFYFIKLHKKEDPKFNDVFKDFSTNFGNNFLTYFLEGLYIVLWTLLFIIPGIIKTYSYAMTMYLKAKNPALGANEAITLSRKIMHGRKWKFFCLMFSFVGWAILSILTFGIGYLFLMPYIRASQVAFFEEAINEYEFVNNIRRTDVVDVSEDDIIVHDYDMQIETK